MLVTSLLIMVALALFIRYTKMGKAMRATAQNRKMAMLLGIDADRIISLTFIIGSALPRWAARLLPPAPGRWASPSGFWPG